MYLPKRDGCTHTVRTTKRKTPTDENCSVGIKAINNLMAGIEGLRSAWSPVLFQKKPPPGESTKSLVK